MLGPLAGGGADLVLLTCWAGSMRHMSEGRGRQFSSLSSIWWMLVGLGAGHWKCALDWPSGRNRG